MPWRVKLGASVGTIRRGLTDKEILSTSVAISLSMPLWWHSLTDEHGRYQMGHAKSLRVIGQSLEVAKLRVFELQTDGANYVLSSDSLSRTGEWILRHALSRDNPSDQRAPQSTVSRVVSFGQSDISRLDEQAQKLRRNDSSPHTESYSRLSQLLRTLGDHLDQTKVSTFQISWTPDSVSVVFESVDRQSDSRTFTTEKLQELGSHLRFRRSSRSRFDSNPDSLKHTRPRIR